MAIKKRELQNNQVLDEQAFIDGAVPTDSDAPNPKAPRNYKSHTLAMNEHEYQLLQSLAEHYGQSHSGIIRYALKQLANQIKLD